MFAGGFAVQTAIIPLHKRAIWIGIISSTFAIASIVGPVIGGALTQHVTWRWCFYINLPIGGLSAAIFVLLVYIKSAETERGSLLGRVKGLDGIGFALFVGFITMLLLALQWGGGEYAWDSSVIIGLFVGFTVALGLFIPWQIYLQDNALIPPRLFRAHRNVGLLCASSFFVNGPFQVIIYWLPIWFQAVLGVSPTQSGVDYLPTVVSDAVMALLGTGVVMKIGWWNPFLLFANVMVCLCGGLLSTISPGISSGHWIGYQILGGVGYSLATNLVCDGEVEIVTDHEASPLEIVADDLFPNLSRHRSACKPRCHPNSFPSGLPICLCSYPLAARSFLPWVSLSSRTGWRQT